ncbi:MAG: ABC transporter substrate-binding protein [Bacteroidia bacterium]|nr:ABC transporter substrate-binding protein [Bacteroidia bacterium]
MKNRVLILGSLLLLLACGRFENKDTKQENEERIVLISKQYCEIIHALGAQNDVVAVDLSSVYPPEVKKLPTVGYHRALSLEGLLAAKPTLIMHSGLNTLGPEHVVAQLQDLKIPMKEFSTQSKDIESTKALMKEMGAWFHQEARADSLCLKLDHDMAIALDNAKKYADKPSVLIIHFGRASNVYLVMGLKGSAAKMVDWAGGTMAVTDTSGMKHLSAEIVTQYDPEVILLTDFGYDRLGSNEKIKELPGVSGTRAARNNRIYRVNECDLVYFGPRTGEITLELQKLIHQPVEGQ